MPHHVQKLDKLMKVADPVVARQRTVLHRLIAGHHVKLKEVNKEKLTKLGELLLHRVGKLAAASPPSADSLAADAAAAARADGVVPEFVPPSALLQPLCPALFSLAEQLPVPMALLVLEEIDAVRSGWRQARKALGSGAGGDGSAYVELPPPALALLALVVQLYPLSDFRHVVTTPLVLLVQEVLSQPGLPSTAVGTRRTLFLCSIALHMVAAAGRWMPELHLTAQKLLERLMGAARRAARRCLRGAARHSTACTTRARRRTTRARRRKRRRGRRRQEACIRSRFGSRDAAPRH